MAKARNRRRQFSLLQLLLVTIFVGILAGLGGPRLVQLLRAPSPASLPSGTRVPRIPRSDRDGADAYYESAETPLD